jgi:hypothetical protein
MQWNSKLPQINIQIDTKASLARGSLATAALRGTTPTDLNNITSNFHGEVPIANKMFPKRYRKHISMEKTTHHINLNGMGSNLNSSGVGTLKGVVDVGTSE